jgi:hypothetical protein
MLKRNLKNYSNFMQNLSDFTIKVRNFGYFGCSVAELGN